MYGGGMTYTNTLSFLRVSALASSMLLAGCGAPAQPTGEAAATLPPTRSCAPQQAPVCAMVGSTRQTYSNSCLAENAGGTDITPGLCPVVIPATQ